VPHKKPEMKEPIAIQQIMIFNATVLAMVVWLWSIFLDPVFETGFVGSPIEQL
jgi:hypothetical protein